MRTQRISQDCEIEDTILDELEKTIPGNPMVVIDVAFYQLAPILPYLKKDSAILELGCGGGIDEQFVGPFEDYSPILSRMLHHLGYNIIGIDLADNTPEPFKTIQAQLLYYDFSDFSPSSIDVAIAFKLFTSPSLREMYGGAEDLKGNIMPHLERIVKPEGIFLYD